MIDETVLAAAKAMQAHPNWSKPGYVITYDELEANNYEHDLLEAVDYFKAKDPARLAKLLEGVRD